MEIGSRAAWRRHIGRHLTNARSRGVSAAVRPTRWLGAHRSEFMAVAMLALMLAPLLL